MNRIPADSQMRRICDVLDKLKTAKSQQLMAETGMSHDMMKKYLKRLRDRGAVHAEGPDKFKVYSLNEYWQDILDMPEQKPERKVEPVNESRGKMTRHLVWEFSAQSV